MPRKDFPRRGNVLSQIVSAFRLTRKTRSGSGTQKRIYNDEPDVSEAAFDAEIRSIVDDVFSLPYLAARSLSEAEVNGHQQLVSTALAGCLRCWDRFATCVRIGSSTTAMLPPALLASFFGVDRDILVRAAAYDHLYGDLHPVRVQLAMSVRKPGLKDWWASFQREQGLERSINQLVERTGLTRKTLNRLRTGQVPDGGVITSLAGGLAELGATRAAEIEFELRAVLAAQKLVGLARAVDPVHVGHWRDEYRIFAAVVDGMERKEVVDLLRRGIDSGAWSTVEGALVGAAKRGLFDITRLMAARAAALKSIAEADPIAAMRVLAADARKQAAELRAMAAEFNGSPTDLLAEFWDFTAELMEAGVEGRSPRPMREGFSAELRSMVGVMCSLDPWSNRSPEERERHLLDAIASSPLLVEPRERLAGHLFAQGRVDEAIDQHREIVKLHPDSADARYHLAVNLGLLQRYDDALEVVVACRVEDTRLRGVRGWCLARLGRMDEARCVLEAVLADDRNDVRALEGMVVVEEAAGNTRKASELRRRAAFVVGLSSKTE